MQSTHNTLSEDIPVHSVELLNKHLAAAIDLHVQVKQTHWNVVPGRSPRLTNSHGPRSSDELWGADTADLFTEISLGIDHQLWFVESYVAPKKSGATLP